MAVDNLRHQNYSCHLRKKYRILLSRPKHSVTLKRNARPLNLNIVNLMKARNLPDTLTSFVIVLCAHRADVASRTVLHFATRIGTIPIFAYLNEVRNLRHCYWRSCIRFVNPQSLSLTSQLVLILNLVNSIFRTYPLRFFSFSRFIFRFSNWK